MLEGEIADRLTITHNTHIHTHTHVTLYGKMLVENECFLHLLYTFWRLSLLLESSEVEALQAKSL